MKALVGKVVRGLAPVLVLVWSLISAFPVYFMAITSVKTQAGYLQPPPWGLPQQWTWENYRAVLEAGFIRYFVNSVVVALSTALISVFLSLLAAYAVNRGKTPIYRQSLYIFLLGFAVPAQATVIALYALVKASGLYDSLWAVILPLAGFAMPVTVLVLTNFVREIPSTLFEAMELEGASHGAVLKHLVLPLSVRAVISMALFNFIGAWNALLFPLILTQSPEVRVLPMAVWTFTGQFGINVPAVMAAVTLSALPLILAYVFARREILNALRGGFV
ncbi:MULTISPECIES: carbohydrate ABC transporter permease [Thermus]|jgi:raffinose/stachyose/melibiose transport system permease protein|uniref:Sugar ABC transporter permease n=1 Tax=Thermus brockianus TaxID=56956 RepID=A0A1J0LY34_THEBO|nr:carbohydrate ABC transporter permease [Thermus brockianus]APD10375.1 sugar ABC transporter permease [Thermus brockianus]